MDKILPIGLGVFLGCAGLALFNFALDDAMYDLEQIRQNVINETIIRVGEPGDGPCSVDIPLETWDEMNQIGIYKWIVACEESQKENTVDSL